ncbi:hypothetical protein N7490_012043 [Penicillium lividum]|nr:hypothetical protein N7490_012043 [Penicillium lividum]
MSICIALGPENAYFVHAPKRWAFGNLPEDVMTLLNQQPPITDIREMALGPNGSFLVVYNDSDGTGKLRYRNLPADLQGWLIRNGASVRHHASLQCSLGPNGAFFAIDVNGTIRGNLSAAMENACKERSLPNGVWRAGATPTSATFGPDGQFFITTADGGGYWNLAGSKGELGKTLEALNSLKDILVVLSPFHNDHWVLVDSRGTGMINGEVGDAAVPDFNNFEADLQEHLRNQRAPIQAKSVSQFQPQKSQHQPQNSHQRRSSNIVKGIHIGFKLMNNVMGGGGGGGVGDFVNNIPSIPIPTNGFNAGDPDLWTPIQNAASGPIQ